MYMNISVVVGVHVCVCVRLYVHVCVFLFAYVLSTTDTCILYVCVYTCVVVCVCVRCCCLRRYRLVVHCVKRKSACVCVCW